MIKKAKSKRSKIKSGSKKPSYAKASAGKSKELSPEDVLAQKIIKVLEEKKAEDIRIFHVTKLTSYTDYFIFCTGRNDVHLKAMAADIQKELKKDGMNVKDRSETGTGWIAIDCGMVVVHCFGSAERAYYDLEELWQDADVVYHHY